MFEGREQRPLMKFNTRLKDTVEPAHSIHKGGLKASDRGWTTMMVLMELWPLCRIAKWRTLLQYLRLLFWSCFRMEQTCKT